MFNSVEIVNLKDNEKVEEVRSFLGEFNLEYESDIDFTVIIRSQGEIIGTCSKAGKIFKCFAIKKEFQGEGLSSKLITELNNKLFDEGVYHSFIFTKPENIGIFTGIGYKGITETDKVALLENGMYDIKKYMKKTISKYSIDVNKQSAALVMNCNPFTKGHQYIIERASMENEQVIVFIVEEDRSLFPFKNRIELVKKGVERLENVKVIPGGEYIISSATFPNYFLRKNDDKLEVFTRLDAKVFRDYFCEYFNIHARYLGEEPYCEVTRAYNRTLESILGEKGIEVKIIKRKEINEDAISASMVREYIKREEWGLLENLVPEVTLDFLKSEKGREIVEKIKKSDSPH